MPRPSNASQRPLNSQRGGPRNEGIDEANILSRSRHRNTSARQKHLGEPHHTVYVMLFVEAYWVDVVLDQDT
jgi:hypothetical protein